MKVREIDFTWLEACYGLHDVHIYINCVDGHTLICPSFKVAKNKLSDAGDLECDVTVNEFTGPRLSAQAQINITLKPITFNSNNEERKMKVKRN